MAILRRKHNGQFKKALVRVGDVVVSNVSAPWLGITANRGYKVEATTLSLKRTSDFHSECTRPEHFIIVNDFGEKLVQALPRANSVLPTPNRHFCVWTLSSVK